MSKQTKMSTKETTNGEVVYINPKFVIQSKEEYGVDKMLIISNEPKIHKSAKGTTTYYNMRIKTPSSMLDEFPEESYPMLLKTGRVKITGCATYKERNEKRKNAGPSFGIYKDSITLDVKNNKLDEEDLNNKVGEALAIISESWNCIIENHKKLKKEKIHKFMQTSYVKNDEEVEMTNPLIRIKVKCAPETELCKIPIVYVDLKGKQYKTFPHDITEERIRKGDAFNNKNIHHILKSGYVVYPIFDFSTTILSSMGVSNNDSVRQLIVAAVKTGKTAEEIFADELKELISERQENTAESDDEEASVKKSKPAVSDQLAALNVEDDYGSDEEDD